MVHSLSKRLRYTILIFTLAVLIPSCCVNIYTAQSIFFDEYKDKANEVFLQNCNSFRLYLESLDTTMNMLSHNSSVLGQLQCKKYDAGENVRKETINSILFSTGAMNFAMADIIIYDEVHSKFYYNRLNYNPEIIKNSVRKFAGDSSQFIHNGTIFRAKKILLPETNLCGGYVIAVLPFKQIERFFENKQKNYMSITDVFVVFENDETVYNAPKYGSPETAHKKLQEVSKRKEMTNGSRVWVSDEVENISGRIVASIDLELYYNIVKTVIIINAVLLALFLAAAALAVTLLERSIITPINSIKNQISVAMENDYE